MKPTTRKIGWAGAILLVAASVNAANIIIPGRVKHEVWPGSTRTAIEAGTQTPTIAPSITYPTSWDIPDGGADNFGTRTTGLIIPATTGLYDFVVATDDDGDLFLSTNNLPAGKVLIARELTWDAGVRNWISVGTGGIVSQKNSATYTNNSGVAINAAGILLQAGTQYYMEIIQHEGGGGDHCGTTMVPHGYALTNGEATTLTGSLIAVEVPAPTTLTFSVNPSNTTAYVGMSARLTVTTTSDSAIAATYQWRKSGVDIPGAIQSSYNLVTVSTNDNGATYDCVASVPSTPNPMLATSTVATVTVPATGAITLAGLRQELYNGVNGNKNRLLDGTNLPAPSTVNARSSLDISNTVASLQRVSGFYTPTVTGDYVFFLASRDDSRLLLSTTDQPKDKQVIAEDTDRSAQRGWTTSTRNSILSQKRSDTWTNSAGASPFASGIHLEAGKRYFIEAEQTSGGNAATCLSATAALVADAALVVDGQDTTLTNPALSFLSAPATSFAITQPPTNTVVTEGLSYTFRVVFQNGSEFAASYQWRTNGVNITNATAATYYVGSASLTDSTRVYDCLITVPAVAFTTNSTGATLTVNPGILALGQIKHEVWYTGGPSRAQVNAGTTVVPNVSEFRNEGFDLPSTNPNIENYVDRLSAYFVPAVSGNYVFFVCGDDDADLWLSTDSNPANKVLRCQETGWSNQRNWLSVGASTLTQKRSDQWTNAAGVALWASGIPLTAGTRYYMEVVHHDGTSGDAIGATFKLAGEVDPQNGTPSKLIGSLVGVLGPPATTLNITENPVDASAYVWQAAYFHVDFASDALFPPSIQWRRNGVNIPNANGKYYGLVCSSNDNNATFDCVITTAGVAPKTSTPAKLTVKPGATFVAGALNHEFFDNALSAAQVEQGGYGPPTYIDTLPEFDIGPAVQDGYVQRINGLFLPPATGSYVFFVSSDDDTDLFINTTSDQPAGKELIAQVTGYDATRRLWTSATTGSTTQKRSDQYSPDGGTTFPYPFGIPLDAGKRYYMEAVHHDGTGGNYAAVTVIQAFTADPVNGDPTVLTNALIGYMKAPVSSKPTLTATRSGNNIVVSWTPAGGVLIGSTNLALDPATWPTVSTTNPATIPFGSGLYMRAKQ